MDPVRFNLNQNSHEQTAAHARNFLDCIKSRQLPSADIEIGHRSTTMSLLALNASAAEDSSASAIGGMQADALVYRTDKGVLFQVAAEGLSLIQVGGRDLACGGWTVFNAEPWFKDSGSGRVDTKSWREKSIAVVGQRQARVRHVKGDITCLTDYTFAGEDLLISARVENSHAIEPLKHIGVIMSGRRFGHRAGADKARAGGAESHRHLSGYHAGSASARQKQL